MRIKFVVALFLILGIASAAFVGGWKRQNPEMTSENMDLINFGLRTIAEANNGFNAFDYQPVKMFDLQTQVVAGRNTKILVELDNGKGAFDSKKLVQLVVHSGFGNKTELLRWSLLDSAATFEAINADSTLELLKNATTQALVYEDHMEDRTPAEYQVSRVLAIYQTKRDDQTLYYIKAMVQGTDNSIRAHEFWFVKGGLYEVFGDHYEVFAHQRLPINRETLQNHPQLTLVRDSYSVHCENLASYFFCEISTGCVNNMLGAGRCDSASKNELL